MSETHWYERRIVIHIMIALLYVTGSLYAYVKTWEAYDNYVAGPLPIVTCGDNEYVASYYSFSGGYATITLEGGESVLIVGQVCTADSALTARSVRLGVTVFLVGVSGVLMSLFLHRARILVYDVRSYLWYLRREKNGY